MALNILLDDFTQRISYVQIVDHKNTMRVYDYFA